MYGQPVEAGSIVHANVSMFQHSACSLNTRWGPHPWKAPAAPFWLFLFVFVWLVVPGRPTPLWADPPLDQSLRQMEHLVLTIDQVLENERAGLETVYAQLKSEQADRALLDAELRTYTLQESATANLFSMSQVSSEDLQRARNQAQITLDSLDARLNAYTRKITTNIDLKNQIANQLTLYTRQLNELREDQPDLQNKTVVEQKASAVIVLLKNKGQAVDSLATLYTQARDRVREHRDGFADIINQADQLLKERKKEELFQRKTSLTDDLVASLYREIGSIPSKFRPLLEASQRSAILASLGQGAVFRMSAALLFFCLAIVLFRRLQGMLAMKEKACCRDAGYARRFLVFTMLRRSAVILGVLVFLSVYRLMQLPGMQLPVFSLILGLLQLQLIGRWWYDWLSSVDAERLLILTQNQILALRRLIRTLVLLLSVYLAFKYLAGPIPVLLSAGRLLLEIILAVWCLIFWRTDARTAGVMVSRPVTNSIIFLKVLSYTVIFGGLFMESAGYGVLSQYWYIAWVRMATVLLWGALLYGVLIEWQRQAGGLAGRRDQTGLQAVLPLRWITIQVCWIVWFAGLVIGLLSAWGDSRDIFGGTFRLLSYSVPVGNLHFSLLGVFNVLLTLFLTHIIVRLFRYLLREKFLADSPLEPGLQDSITTISAYLIWGLGVLAALSVLGVSATSLAVVFGALSIGIGFGLQNIFNNFISGIILLFERPIQIGDAVEINGIWGEVKKINVRSTVVQTYDNASMIIPNSEFIANQVTNWSFKDKSIRRKVKIGVAYGSDIELVRSTLLEIAGRAKNVLAFPGPDVLFSDHGDSALIFTLRYWTTVDYYFSTETEIRFALDHLFRERGIEIAFPQMDLHIRSVSPDVKL